MSIKNNRTKALENERRYRANNKEKCRIIGRCKAYRRLYGLTLEQVKEWSESLDHKCEICGIERPFDTPGRNTKLHVDHCHTTGKLRGMLCSRCNNALGCIDDCPDRLQKLIDYLERSK